MFKEDIAGEYMGPKRISSITFKQGSHEFYLCAMPASDLVQISYVAHRGQSEEEGAVQRLLNPKRISGIKKFILSGGTFPNNIILNWTSDNYPRIENSQIEYNLEVRQAQLLDGQHRVAGLREAIKEDPSVGDMIVPTVVGKKLSTEECAAIFLSINSEQKAVPKSLIYDLYNLIPSSEIRDFALDRSNDIASALNDNDDSPYQGLIKFPGQRTRGGIQLSTVVTGIKKLVKPEGDLQKYKVDTLDRQVRLFKNYFCSIRDVYGANWDSSKNPFIYAAGFSAAVDVLSTHLLTICFSRKSFEKTTFDSLFSFHKEQLLWQESVKGLGGEAAKQIIRDFLIHHINTEDNNSSDYKF